VVGGNSGEATKYCGVFRYSGEQGKTQRRYGRYESAGFGVTSDDGGSDDRRSSQRDRTNTIEQTSHCELLVVFLTYQSLQAIADVQGLRDGLGEFDLIIWDEAHWTTGATIAGQEESYFVKIHDNEFASFLCSAQERLFRRSASRVCGTQSAGTIGCCFSSSYW